ncbi:alpha-amylase family glycosyl hydrolase, partial [Blautia pseudococcoides]|nr:alpha-amylase family glycosyl hydrolase [Blautia pseudococcoides]
KGLLFDANHILLDPYAKAVTGQSVWGKKVNENGYRARVVRNDFFWGRERRPHVPMDELIIYEMHVRGFTKLAEDVEHPGTFAGIKEKIPYLKDLGVNAVELMPIFEFDELRERRMVDNKQVINYWGYNTVAFFAPNTSYAATKEYNREGLELKELVHALHENGMEVILDVVFNHTAEGNENGPFISFKGFDNNIYYLLTPDGHYYNFSGCGNTLNCNHPVVRRMIQECLRYWVAEYHIDGFRFDLASILGRNEDGSPMDKPPLVEALAYDSLLSSTRLIAEAWDAGGLYQVGQFPAFRRWSEWNGKYRDDLREYLKGGLWAAQAAAMRIAGSTDIYNPRIRGKNASVNFLTCHDGFTLYDLYSYNWKHNEANGWENRDGSDDNRSWNCGAEGETEDPQVIALRMRLIKNACAVLMCSRGTPMFYAGDEFCNTQYGNNNAYCQDNEISWIDWNRLETHRDVYEFFRFMIHFRKEHKSISGNLGSNRFGLPEISFHGEHPWVEGFGKESRVTAVMFTGYDEKKGKDDIVYLLINVYWEPVTISLPELPKPLFWHVSVNTGEAGAEWKKQPVRLDGGSVLAGPRSVLVLTGCEFCTL